MIKVLRRRLDLNRHPTDLLHLAETLRFDVYSKEVYCSPVAATSGLELWGDDSADGLIEIIAAGRGV